MTDIAKELAEPFPSELLRQNKAKGNITYVAGSEVIARLNRVLGYDGWSYEVLRMWEAGEQTTDTGSFPTWVMAHVRLTVPVRGEFGVFTTRDGVGGQQVKKLNSGAGVVDLGDEYKGAVTDALKKAAMSFGVALDLARGEEAMKWEADQSDDIDCPFCGASIAGAKSDREPMRAHLVEMHDYLRNTDGTVIKPAPPEAPAEGGAQVEGAETSGNLPPQAGLVSPAASAAPSVRDKPALGAVKQGVAK